MTDYEKLCKQIEDYGNSEYEKGQADILDKIRAEIEAEIKGCETAIDMYKENPDIVLCYKTFIQSYTKTLQIIDKYSKEQKK